MDYSPDVIKYEEKAIFTLRTLYSDYGYTPFKVSRFEEYELYAANRAFLPSGDIVAFTGASGNLLALRPDVTLSIVKNIRDEKELKKLCYNENIYRTIDGELKEQMQVGLECIGNIGVGEVAEVLMLAKKSLDSLGKSTRLDISHTGFEDAEAKKELSSLDKALRELGITDGVNIDMEVAGDVTYYNGIVFQGFIEGIPQKVLSGGRYDELLRNFGKNGGAIGFAVNLDLVSNPVAATPPKPKTISIALPKGRLGEAAIELFNKAGFDCPDMENDSRKLVFENPDKGIRFFWVKSTDVAIYVERGVADIGIVGKDTLLETRRDVYELLNLGLGKCRMCVAAKVGVSGALNTKTLRVATKFPNISREYYGSIGVDIDIIKLGGSIELAPLLGLSDVIVDLVETGKTLKDNNMEVVETIADISARLIANKTSYKFNQERIDSICKKL